MRNIVQHFNANRRLYTTVILIGVIFAGFGIWNFNLAQPTVLAQPLGREIIIPTMPFKVAAAGDWGCGENTKDTISNIISKKPDVILSLGDMSYEGTSGPLSVCGTTQDWFDMTAPFGKNFFMVVGNHDLPKPGYPDLLKNYLDHFDLCPLTKPEPCGDTYSFTKNKVHFLILNSEYGWEKGSSQYLLAERDLEKASSDKNIKWIIVAYHDKGYSSVDLDLGRRIFGVIYPEKTKEFTNIYHPLFDRYGVDLVLLGHVHNYQRTYPLLFGGENKLPIRTTASFEDKNVLNNPKGEIYVTVGTGGVGLNPIESDNQYIAYVRDLDKPTDDYYLANSDDSHYGFLQLEFSNEESNVIGEFIGKDAIHKGSVVLDHFTISK